MSPWPKPHTCEVLRLSEPLGAVPTFQSPCCRSAERRAALPQPPFGGPEHSAPVGKEGASSISRKTTEAAGWVESRQILQINTRLRTSHVTNSKAQPQRPISPRWAAGLALWAERLEGKQWAGRRGLGG